MKKVLALLLMIVVLVGCVSALADSVTIPATMQEAQKIDKPVLTGYSLTVEDGRYVLKADQLNHGNVFIEVSGLDEEYENDTINLYWDSSEGAYFSDRILGEKVFLETSVRIWNEHQADMEDYYQLDMESGSLNYVEARRGSCYYRWHDNEDQFNYYDGQVDVWYNSQNGKLSNYTIHDGNLTISYDRYGSISYAEYGDYDNGVYAYWDFNDNCWYDYDGNVADIPAFVEDDHQPPFAVEYVVDIPAWTVDEIDHSKGSVSVIGGLTFHETEFMTAVYDMEGNLERYNYWTVNHSSMATYDAEGKLLNAQVMTADGRYNYVDGQGWYFAQGWNDRTPVAELPEDVKAAVLPPLLVEKEEPVEEEPEYMWYSNNTVGVAGLSLRDMGKTDKWYNVVPVDLSCDGEYTYSLVASNLYHIGKATVTVADGQATVNYKLHDGHGYMKSECVKWFASIDDITADFLNDPVSDLAFGQPMNIAEELGDVEVGDRKSVV